MLPAGLSFGLHIGEREPTVLMHKKLKKRSEFAIKRATGLEFLSRFPFRSREGQGGWSQVSTHDDSLPNAAHRAGHNAGQGFDFPHGAHECIP
jgi:hypothetical protein